MRLRLSIVFTFCLFAVSSGRAQDISITGGNQVLSITTAVPGTQPTSVSNTVTTLQYTKQKNPSKITVGTSCVGQKFTLKVLALNPSAGTAAPEVTLNNGAMAVDFITGIPKTGPSSNSCTLQYTASATFAQGNSNELGNDVHVVTYTLIEQ